MVEHLKRWCRTENIIPEGDDSIFWNVDLERVYKEFSTSQAQSTGISLLSFRILSS